ILLVIILLLLLVISGVAVSLWIGINSGLLPLNKIRMAMSERSPADLTPVTIEQAPREVLPMLEAINTLLSELRIYIASQSRFVSDAAHQLRTPLAGLKTFVDLGAMQADDERSIKIFEQLNVGVGRLTRMTNGLLSLARAEASSDRFVTHQQIDMNVLTRETVKSLSQVWKGKSSTKISFRPGSTAALIAGSEESLRDLLENLVNNSVAYTQDGGEVNVWLGTTDGVELVVEDNGPGIPSGEREKIFERFYRLDRPSNTFGSGLGLAIVKEIADNHAALITIADGKNGKGCRFSVKFPQAKLVERNQV
ncbi:MAG TPA: HAMP domain-containing sensor histidine kinase, partial [Trichormus sp.]